VAVILDVFNLVLFIELLICVTTSPVSDFRHAACHSAFPKAGGGARGAVGFQTVVSLFCPRILYNAAVVGLVVQRTPSILNLPYLQVVFVRVTSRGKASVRADCLSRLS
jgi:hypothetical protein